MERASCPPFSGRFGGSLFFVINANSTVNVLLGISEDDPFVESRKHFGEASGGRLLRLQAQGRLSTLVCEKKKNERETGSLVRHFEETMSVRRRRRKEKKKASASRRMFPCRAKKNFPLQNFGGHPRLLPCCCCWAHPDMYFDSKIGSKINEWPIDDPSRMVTFDDRIIGEEKK